MLAFLALASCSASPGAPPAAAIPRPAAVEVLELPAGTRVRTELAAGLPDEPLIRAAAIWWREALRQSPKFDVGDEGDTWPATELVLAIDVEGRRASAFCRSADGRERALWGESFPGGDLAAAIDRLAWASRIALGEAADPPVAVAACVSGHVGAVLAAFDGFALLRDGGVASAGRAFEAARRGDGGSPFVLDGLATVALLRGDANAAQRICREALGYEARLAPTTRHRLARTLLLARASLDPTRAPDRDRELLALGQVVGRERPHDPQARLTEAIAHNFLGDFAAARPILTELRARYPRQAVVSYHLGWSCLATGDAVAAIDHFADAGARLPMPWVAIPRALAHYVAGDHDGLTRLLDRLAEDAGEQAGEPLHELMRMRAAHALLRGDAEAAADDILRTLNWLLKNPATLDRRPGEFAEQGEVLVRLGRYEALPALIAAVQNQMPGTAVADACAYLSGMIQIAASRTRAVGLEGRLGRGGDSVFALRLQAFAHEVRGELADMHAALARAARLSDSPLTKALLAESLGRMGRGAEARALRAALRRELTAIDLRRRPSHPLLGPELAYAFVLE